MSKSNRSRNRHRPPGPEVVEGLRAALNAIDPEQLYSMAMPDGAVFLARGKSLLETGRAVVALAEADVAGDDDAMQAALKRIVAAAPGPEQNAVICARVGMTLSFGPPPGYLTTDCGRCGHAVWISPANHRRVVEDGGRAHCNVCVMGK